MRREIGKVGNKDGLIIYFMTSYRGHHIPRKLCHSTFTLTVEELQKSHLRSPNTFRGVSRPSDVARPVKL